MNDILGDFIAEILEKPGPVFVECPQQEPEDFSTLLRALHPTDPHLPESRPDSIGDSRKRIIDAMTEYLDMDAPSHILLIRAAPGVGKTHAAVHVAEDLARSDKRVLYAGPRHDFFGDVIAIAENPGNWYEWLPRQVEDQDKGKVQTCGYVDPISEWMKKGYPAMDFCSGICGWDYVKVCPYHVQKKRPEPIIYGNHLHVTLGHPLQFNVVIGDEDPIAAFINEWKIPAKWVAPKGMDPAEPLTPIIHRLAYLATHEGRYEGKALLDEIGGADQVLEAARLFSVDVNAQALAPDLHRAEDVERADYFHLPILCSLLATEAEGAVNGLEYVHRVIVENGNLVLLLRKPTNETMPQHVIWLDATGEPRLYEAVFQRPVVVVDATPKLQGRVLQVWERSNNKTRLTGGKSDLAVEQTAVQVQAIVEREGYKNAAVISFQGLLDDGKGDPSSALKALRDMPSMHFYAARGSNSLKDCDALFVIGTPQPSAPQMVRRAAMIFAERRAAFVDRWLTQLRPYSYLDGDGNSYAYPVSGFWADPDLQAVLWSLREAEIVQAAHRVRPSLRPADVWLLTNVPMEDLPPTRLLSIAESIGAPDNVDAFRWPAVVWYVESVFAEKGYVEIGDLMNALDLDRETSEKYLRLMGWQEKTVFLPPAGKRGRPPKRFVPPA